MNFSKYLEGFNNWIKKQWEPTTYVRPRDVIREIPGVVKDIAQGTARNIASPFVSLTGQKQINPQNFGRFPRVVFGNEPIKGLSTRFSENTQAQKSYVGNFSKLTGPATAIGSIGLDIFGVGKSKVASQVSKIPPRTFRNLIQPVETVIGHMGDTGTALKKLLTSTLDKGEVEAAKRVNELMKTKLLKLKKEEKLNLFDSLEGRTTPLNPKVQQAFNVIRQITDETAQQAKDIGVQVRRKMTINPDAADPLITEARKYKSAEEFVNDSKQVFRGGEPFDASKTKLSGKGIGSYFSTDKKFAQSFADELLTGKYGKKSDVGISEFHIQSSAKILERKDFPKKFLQDYQGGEITSLADIKNRFGGPHGLQDTVAKWAIKNGYDVVDYSGSGKNLIVVNPEVLKTKSQLTDIWNKAQESKFPVGLTSLQRQKLTEGKSITGRFKVPFEPRENYYPHAQVYPDVLKGKLKKDIAENLVRLKVKPNIEEANRFIDEYKEFIETGKRQESLINYMVETGQSKNAAEALNNLQRFRTRTIKRSGSLEYSREVDLPFYDPDPSRTLPSFIESTSKRLEQIKAFGQDNEVINKMILEIRNGGGNADLARKATDRILGIMNDNDTAVAKASAFVRMVQGFKLGLAAIPNSTQGVLNSLLYADMWAVGAGIKGALTSSGREFSLKSGAKLGSVVQEAGRESGALSTFLKATGFNAAESLNRTIASNAGRSYGTRLFQKLLQNPNHSRSARILEELGVDTKKALQAGQLSEDDILMIGKRFSDITQFRSRPQDLPLFASTPIGKVFFQFKSFIYGQTRLLYKATVSEAKSGNFGRATRNLLILGTIFPLAGEVIADIRALITGRERESRGLERYFENMANVGASGLLGSLLEAGKYQGGAEFIAGPTGSDIGKIIDIAGGPNKAKNATKFMTRKIPIIGNRITNALFPDKATESKTTKSKATKKVRREIKKKNQ